MRLARRLRQVAAELTAEAHNIEKGEGQARGDGPDVSEEAGVLKDSGTKGLETLNRVDCDKVGLTNQYRSGSNQAEEPIRSLHEQWNQGYRATDTAHIGKNAMDIGSRVEKIEKFCTFDRDWLGDIEKRVTKLVEDYKWVKENAYKAASFREGVEERLRFHMSRLNAHKEALLGKADYRRVQTLESTLSGVSNMLVAVRTEVAALNEVVRAQLTPTEASWNLDQRLKKIEENVKNVFALYENTQRASGIGAEVGALGECIEKLQEQVKGLDTRHDNMRAELEKKNRRIKALETRMAKDWDKKRR